MSISRLSYLLVLCCLLMIPGYAQTLMQARRLLFQAGIFIDDKRPQEALKAVAEGLQVINVLKLKDSSLEARFYVFRARAYKLLHDDASILAAFDRAKALYQPLVIGEEQKYQQLLWEYADYQNSQQRNNAAIQLYLEALKFEPQPPQPQRLDTARLLHSLATAYRDQGDLLQAFLVFNEALRCKERLLSADDPSLAITLSDLGGVCRQRGQFELAEQYVNRALEIRKLYKEASPQGYARVLNNLSLVKQAEGAYREALTLAQESFDISLQQYGPDHQEMIIPGLNLAEAYKSLGDFKQAEQLDQQALTAAQKYYASDSLEVAGVKHNLGTLLLEMNDLEKARTYLEQALAIRRQHLPAKYQDLLPTMVNLASVHRQAGRDQEALSLYREALALQQASLGPDHPDVASTLDLMAGLPVVATDQEQLLALTQRAYEIRRKVFGVGSPRTAQSEYSLGLLSYRRGDLEQAKKQFTDAIDVFSHKLRADHLFAGRAAYQLGSIAFDQGHKESALIYAKREARALLATTEDIFAFASERQRLAYASKLHPYDLLASLGEAREVATAVLRYKGAVLDSIIEDLRLARQSSDAQVHERVTQLLKVREQLANLLGEQAEIPQEDTQLNKARLDKVARLRNDLERLETAVARDGYSLQEFRRSFRITPDEVIEALPKDSLLLELLRYRQLSGNGKLVDSYGAVIMAPGQEIVWQPLGAASEIDNLIWRYKQFVRGRDSEGHAGGQVLQELYNTLWLPWAKSLPADITTVVISPDSQLNFVSFATLLDDKEQFLGQRYNLVYVASGRDLLQNPPSTDTNEVVLVGDPIFADQTLEPLPFTRKECQELSRLFAAQTGLEVRELLGKEASESQVKAITRPRNLHIATHGYFQPQARTSKADPMSRSGLILTADGVEDGYLTAGEVSLLDLKGTALVVLSACDTGLGLAQAGEGVLGLRRGFIKAGAHNLLLTLWPIPDETTSAFMADFVKRSQTVEPALALAQVQRQWLLRLSQEHSPQEAVRQVGAFVLNLQGGF